MSVNFNVVIADAFGVELQVASSLVSLQAARAFNTIGSGTLVLNDSDYPPWFWRKNMRIKIYRSSDNGPFALLGNTEWFLKSANWKYSEGVWEIGLKDTISILDGPLIAYPQDTIYADKTFENINSDTPNNLMRAFVRENMGSLAVDPDRDRSEWLDVEADRVYGDETEKTASYQELLGVLTSIAADSEAAGVPLVMDVVPIADNRYEFRVKHDFLGSDRSSGPGKVAFASGLNNIKDIQFLWDYNTDTTVAYVGGVGDGAGRFTVVVSDYKRVNLNPFNRYERFVDLRDEDSETVLESEGLTYIQKNRSKLVISAQVVDIPGLRFGRDYFYGDRVMVSAGTYEIPCLINAFSTSYSNGEEQLDLRLKGELPL